MTGPVAVSTAGAVRRIELCRPARRNALDDATRQALAAQAEALAEDREVRVVVLSGAGTGFSAGADLRERLPLEPTWAGRRRAAGAWQRLLDAWEALPQVTVAAIHGHAIGGACLLVAACDLRVATDDAWFRIPELALGIPLTWGGLPRLEREVGLPRARDLVLTGRAIGAAEAASWGLVQRVVPREGLQAAVDDLVATLLAQPAAPLAMTKDALAATARRRTSGAWSDPDLLAWSLREGARADPEAGL
jgi:enoyl-CoA hydratase/carnithine racemase